MTRDAWVINPLYQFHSNSEIDITLAAAINHMSVRAGMSMSRYEDTHPVPEHRPGRGDRPTSRYRTQRVNESFLTHESFVAVE